MNLFRKIVLIASFSVIKIPYSLAMELSPEDVRAIICYIQQLPPFDLYENNNGYSGGAWQIFNFQNFSNLQNLNLNYQNDQSEEKKDKNLNSDQYKEVLVQELIGYEDLLCHICLSNIKEKIMQEFKVVRINCKGNNGGHIFCKECIEESYKYQQICPVCRGEIVKTKKPS